MNCGICEILLVISEIGNDYVDRRFLLFEDEICEYVNEKFLKENVIIFGN